MLKKIFKILGIIILIVLVIIALLTLVGSFGKRIAGYKTIDSISRYSFDDLVSGESVVVPQEISLGSSVTPSVTTKNNTKTVSLATVSAGTKRLVVKSGYLSMVVKDVAASVKETVDYTGKNGGFVIYSNISKNGLAPHGEVSVRVPAENLGASIDYIKNLGEVESEGLNGTDVTEEYADLEAQLKNLKATETQYLSILTRSGTISDILAVQRQLSATRGEIEVMEGKIKYLSQNVEMSVLTVEFATDPSQLSAFEEEETWRPLAVLKNAFRGLLTVGKIAVNVLIWVVVLIPVWAVIILLVWLAIKIVRKLIYRGPKVF